MTLPQVPPGVAERARSLGLDTRIVTMADSTRTAEDAAAACGCEVGQIVKSLVFRGAVWHALFAAGFRQEPGR